MEQHNIVFALHLNIIRGTAKKSISNILIFIFY